MNMNDDNDLIEKIKNSLEREKYISRKDASLSIFISTMKTKFRELSILNSLLKEQKKVDYLYITVYMMT